MDWLWRRGGSGTDPGVPGDVYKLDWLPPSLILYPDMMGVGVGGGGIRWG